MNDVAVGTGERGGHQQHGALLPIAVLARKVRLEASAVRQYKRVQPRTAQPLNIVAEICRGLTWHRISVKQRNVWNNFGPGESEMREIAMRLRPFLRNHNRCICRGRS